MQVVMNLRCQNRSVKQWESGKRMKLTNRAKRGTNRHFPVGSWQKTVLSKREGGASACRLPAQVSPTASLLTVFLAIA